MKKTVVLLTIVLALLAAPVFAEITLGGEVNFGVASDFATAADGANHKDGANGFNHVMDTFKLGVTGNVDEFTTAEFNIEFADPSVGAALIGPASVTVKTDVTGVMGLDAPVDVTLITGYNDYFGSKKFHSEDGYGLAELKGNYGSKWNIGADVKIMDMVTVRFGLNAWVQEQKKYTDGLFMGAFVENMNGLSAEAYFVMDDFNTLGLDLVYGLDMNGMKITPSAAFQMLMYSKDNGAAKDTSVIKFGAGVNFVMDALNAGLSCLYTGEDESAAKKADATFALGFDAGYQITDMFKVYAGVKMADLMANNIYFTNKAYADDVNKGTMPGTGWKAAKPNAGADFGVRMSLGAANYYLGYQVGAGKLNNLIDQEGMYMAVKVAF